MMLGVARGPWAEPGRLSLEYIARRSAKLYMRVGVAIVVGGIGGLIGGLVGSLLYGFAAVFFVFGWTLTGLLIGVSIATFELLVSTVNGKNQQVPSKSDQNVPWRDHRRRSWWQHRVAARVLLGKRSSPMAATGF